METNWLGLVTLIPFSRSHKGLDCWKIACLHCISWSNGWILTKLAQPNCCGMENNWFYFGNLVPIFKVARGLRLLDNGLSARYLLNELMHFDQTCTAILLWQRQELIRFFVTLIPFSRLHKGYDFRKWLVSTLSHWGMDEFDQTYI